jgi:hypothetical protein
MPRTLSHEAIAKTAVLSLHPHVLERWRPTARSYKNGNRLFGDPIRQSKVMGTKILELLPYRAREEVPDSASFARPVMGRSPEYHSRSALTHPDMKGDMLAVLQGRSFRKSARNATSLLLVGEYVARMAFPKPIVHHVATDVKTLRCRTPPLPAGHKDICGATPRRALTLAPGVSQGNPFLFRLLRNIVQGDRAGHRPLKQAPRYFHREPKYVLTFFRTAGRKLRAIPLDHGRQEGRVGFPHVR